jgi:benzoyl-CoA reductase/2-hydroxyglutaryl-CoA dehydratase subunit BcrC/BadD/HgdB
METKPKESSVKSMQTAREASYFGKKMLKNAYQAQLEGKPIGWSMVTWFQGELIANALGIELVFPENYGALCAALGLAEPYLERSDSEGFPTTLCGYARNCIGYTAMMVENDLRPPPDAPGGGMPKPAVLISSGAACDARFKWFQTLKRYLGVPQWTLEHPHPGYKEFHAPQHKEKTIRFLVSHLKDFIAFLESAVEVKMDWDKLEENVDTAFKTLRLAHEVDLLRRAVPSPMVAQDFWSIMVPHLYLSYDPEAYQFYKKVYAEVKHRVDNKIGAIPDEKYRMVFAELPPWHSLGFFDQLGSRYGIAMVYESWSYHAPLPIPENELDKNSDPLERIARLTYQKFTDVNALAIDPGAEAFSFVLGYLDAAREYKADGLFCHPLMSCRAATYHLLAVKDMIANQFKVPAVVVNGDIVDLRVFNQSEALQKIEAFIEIMDHFRLVRKDAAIGW